MAEKVIGTSVVVVISPLTSLMKDQVKITTEWHGISAAAIYSCQDDEVLGLFQTSNFACIEFNCFDYVHAKCDV